MSNLTDDIEDTKRNTDFDLVTLEKLDRSSPELWPQIIPGINEFANLKNTEKNGHENQKWMSDLDKEDLNTLNGLGSLSTNQLMEKVKDLMNLSSQLAVEESNQLNRGKLLNVLDSKLSE